MWKKYLVLFLSKDYYTHYEGHKVVKARNENEAINKAAEKLNINPASYIDKNQSWAWVEVEKI